MTLEREKLWPMVAVVAATGWLLGLGWAVLIAIMGNEDQNVGMILALIGGAAGLIVLVGGCVKLVTAEWRAR